jgi:hypothetical protein
MRVIASGGIVKSGGRTYAAKSDTLRLSGTVEVAATEAVMIVSFIGDHGQFLRASVTEGGVENYTGRGEMIVIVRTPMGVQLEAMKAPDDAR